MRPKKDLCHLERQWTTFSLFSSFSQISTLPFSLYHSLQLFSCQVYPFFFLFFFHPAYLFCAPPICCHCQSSPNSNNINSVDITHTQTGSAKVESDGSVSASVSTLHCSECVCVCAWPAEWSDWPASAKEETEFWSDKSGIFSTLSTSPLYRRQCTTTTTTTSTTLAPVLPRTVWAQSHSAAAAHIRTHQWLTVSLICRKSIT